MSLLIRLFLPLFLIGAGVFYQTIFRDLLFITVGVGRVLDPISAFPNYQCRRIRDPQLQACEDMWLDETSRTLYLACSESLAREKWMPNTHKLNATGRSKTDHVVALSIDEPSSAVTANSFTYTILKTPNFPGVDGDTGLQLVGIRGIIKDARTGVVDLYLINNKPSIDPATGRIVDNSATGANTTIEVFETTPGSGSMEHVKTFWDPVIATPNNMAVTEDGGFFFTNDHGSNKHGLYHHLCPLLATGTVAYCPFQGSCKTLTSNLRFPNGLLLHSTTKHLYVPSAATGNIYTYRINNKNAQSPELEQISKIPIPYPIDNLYEDAEGSIWVPAIPKGLQAITADPRKEKGAPSTVFRLKKDQTEGEEGWVSEKMLEDAEGAYLPGPTTIVVHDVRTGRLFISGVVSQFITVCDRV